MSEGSQLKTALMLGLKFKAKLESDNGSRLAFFMRIIIPTLEWTPVTKYLTEAEGTLLSNIVVDAPLYKLSEQQALTYCKVLQHFGTFSLSKAQVEFKGMNDTFWNMLLVDLKIPFHLQALWLQHKDHFLRTEVLHHFQCYGIDEDFSS